MLGRRVQSSAAEPVSFTAAAPRAWENSRRMRGRALALTRGRASLIVIALLTLRVLSIVSVYFFEEDEVSLAVGTAALVADTPGYMYRYAVQVGYYRFVEFATLVLGGSIALVPWIMKGTAAVAGTAIPVAGWFMFRRELSPRQRGLVMLGLALNPALWQSSRYGSTAILSAALSTCALAWLSNPSRRPARVMALAAMAAAVLVRADAVLLLPVAGALVWRTTGSWRVALWELTATAGALGATYAGLLLFDPRMDGALAAVSQHMDTPGPSMFWEFLLWALSPVPAVFAIWGARRLLDVQPRLLAVLCVWALPTLLFYFRATTTTRYFLNVCVPFTIMAAVGMTDAVRVARRWLPRRVSWSLVGLASAVHLFVALGHVPASHQIEYLYGGTFQTHDGPMPTGALLVRSLLTPGSLLRALPTPTFGEQPYPFWEGASFSKAVRRLAAAGSRARTVIVRLNGGFGHAFHYHAQAAGARYDTGPIDPATLWGDALWMRFGNVRVMAVGGWSPAYEALQQVQVVAGDEVWLMDAPGVPADVFTKLPPGLALRPTPTFDDHFRTFAVVRDERQRDEQESGT